MRLDYRVAESRCLGGQIHAALTSSRLLTRPEESLGCVDAGLGFGGSGLDSSAKPCQLSSRQVASDSLLGGGLLLTGSLRLEESGVATGVEIGVAAIDLEHARGHLIEEEPVVADEHHRALEVADLLLEPLDRAEIEVVGRLVQDEDVIWLGEDPGQRHPLELSARELVRQGVDGAEHPEPIERSVDLPPCPERLANGAGGEYWLLLQEAHRDTLASTHRTAVGGHDAGEDPEQGGFAGTVDPDHADAIAVGDRQGQVLKQGPVRPDEGDVLEVEEDGHGSPKATDDVRALEPSARSAHPGRKVHSVGARCSRGD